MGSQVSVKTNDKEQQLKKASKMSLICRWYFHKYM